MIVLTKLHFFLVSALIFFAGLRMRPVFDQLVHGQLNSSVAVKGVLSAAGLIFLAVYLASRRGTRAVPGAAR